MTAAVADLVPMLDGAGARRRAASRMLSWQRDGVLDSVGFRLRRAASTRVDSIRFFAANAELQLGSVGACLPS